MTGEARVPPNVLYFEVLMYLSLALDALSMPFRDDGVPLADALHRWVDGYLRLYYPDDAAVRSCCCCC